jgi:predicted NAD/FAD-dependent oxidoreductase
MNRRGFLRAGVAAAGAWLGGCSRPRVPDGVLAGPDVARAHRLRAGDFPPATTQRRARVVIVGGGVAGLSAAWQLQRDGVNDFLLLETEPEVGGNARAGESPVTRYPWGAHYLPLPTREATDLIALLRDLGVVTGLAPDGVPRYDERHLVAQPRERLFYLGLWQPGHEPRAPASARAQYERFHARMAAFKSLRGADGRPAFATPTMFSSRDPQLRALDRISMAQWLDREGFTDPRLRWYVEYACRDDYGSLLHETSAWAGVHYFAGRQTFGRYEEDTVLTWPEGNAFLVRALAARCAAQTECGWLVHRVAANGHHVTVHAFNGKEGVAIEAERVILAVPWFVRARLLGEPAPAVDYAPWLVANLHVEALPGGHGVGPCWDNLLHDSPSVGYVVATHQQLVQAVTRSVLTYYWPLTSTAPAEGRRLLLERSREEWCERVLADLERAHPDIRALTTRLDVWRWGHGMIKPRPGLLFSDALAAARRPRGRVHFAHSDLSGLSLFEEAHAWGVRAAREVRAMLV